MLDSESFGRWAEAKATIEKAVAADPGYPDPKNNFAYLYLEHGGSKVIADTLGWAFYKMGSYSLAISQLTASVQKAPGNAEYQYHLGMAYFGAQRFAPAAESLQRALRRAANAAYSSSARAALDNISKRSGK